MKYLFVYAPGLHIISFSISCATQWADRNGASVYISTCDLVEYRANENVITVYSKVSVCDKFILTWNPYVCFTILQHIDVLHCQDMSIIYLSSNTAYCRNGCHLHLNNVITKPVDKPNLYEYRIL